jgi:hypothetical protein
LFFQEDQMKGEKNEKALYLLVDPWMAFGTG